MWTLQLQSHVYFKQTMEFINKSRLFWFSHLQAYNHKGKRESWNIYGFFHSQLCLDGLQKPSRIGIANEWDLSIFFQKGHLSFPITFTSLPCLPSWYSWVHCPISISYPKALDHSHSFKCRHSSRGTHLTLAEAEKEAWIEVQVSFKSSINITKSEKLGPI